MQTMSQTCRKSLIFYYQELANLSDKILLICTSRKALSKEEN